MKFHRLDGPSAAVLPQAGAQAHLSSASMGIVEMLGVEADLNGPMVGHSGPWSQIISERASSRRSPR